MMKEKIEQIMENGKRLGEVADFENKTSYKKHHSAILPNRCYVLGGLSALKFNLKTKWIN